MAMARAPTTSSSQLAGRNEANEDDEEELDAVPFAAVSCDSKFRIVNDKTYFRILQNSSA